MEQKLAKELRQIRNLLILIAIRLEATPEQVGKVTGMGANNVSTLIPQRRNRKSATSKKKVANEKGPK